LDHLLRHRFEEALECLVGLCGACRRIPELFWRVSKYNVIDNFQIKDGVSHSPRN